jgi:hypothetical protein
MGANRKMIRKEEVEQVCREKQRAGFGRKMPESQQLSSDRCSHQCE